MPYKKITTILPFNADDLYNMVLDVTKYPEFIPNCKAVILDIQTPDVTLATMKVEIPAFITKFHIEYQSRIDSNPYNHTILIHNTQKSDFFKFMKSYWHIKPCISGAKVVYEVSFELHNPFFNITLSSLFLSQSQPIVDAFTKRAHQILTPIKHKI